MPLDKAARENLADVLAAAEGEARFLINSYDFGVIRKNLGGGVVAGIYSGDSRIEKGSLYLSGDIDFKFSDTFDDAVDYFNLIPDDILGPIDLQGAKVYEIMDEWGGRFEEKINVIRALSNFKSNDV